MSNETAPQEAVRFEPVVGSLEPDGGNFYKPHKLQVHSGQFWRCAHRVTGFGDGMKLIGCDKCAVDDPVAFAKFNET